MENCVGVHKAQEMLAEMFGSFDHREVSSTEQGCVKASICWALLGELLYSFDWRLRENTCPGPTAL